MSTPQLYLQHLERLKNVHLQAPRIGNPYLQDTALLNYTQLLLKDHPKFKKQLTRLADSFVSKYQQASRNAENNPPKLQQFDAYGARIDQLHLSEGWKQLATYSAQDGIVALAYEQDDLYQLGALKRYAQLIVLYMYQPSSGLYGCPLAMTDGAAYILQNICQNVSTRKGYLYQAYQHLISRTVPWTSGQWMTQKKGGSDVSNTQTIAIKQPHQQFYRLYGYKWFTSATDSEIALVLGKVLPSGVQPSAQALISSRVSLFMIRVRDQDNSLNSMQIVRLKDKLGTRQLPTAQILMKGSRAYMISQEGQGVRMISKMLTITRIYNSASAVSTIRRILALARDYTTRRTIATVQLSNKKLQLRVLSHMEVTHRANLILYLKIAHLFSMEQAKTITHDEANILRVMVPIMKLFTGKQVLEVVSQGLESFGAMGYIESSMIPSMLRDAQVLSIWEGTTNVLCLDFVRAILKNQNSINPLTSIRKFFIDIFQRITTSDIKEEHFTANTKKIVFAYTKLMKKLDKQVIRKFKNKQAQLRTYCFSLACIFIAALLQNHYLLTMRQKDMEVTRRWVDRGLLHFKQYSSLLDRQLALDLNEVNQPQGCGDRDQRGFIRPKL